MSPTPIPASVRRSEFLLAFVRVQILHDISDRQPGSSVLRIQVSLPHQHPLRRLLRISQIKLPRWLTFSTVDASKAFLAFMARSRYQRRSHGTIWINGTARHTSDRKKTYFGHIPIRLPATRPVWNTNRVTPDILPAMVPDEYNLSPIVPTGTGGTTCRLNLSKSV